MSNQRERGKGKPQCTSRQERALGLDKGDLKPYPKSNCHWRFTKTRRERNPSKEKWRRRNIETSLSQVSNHLCEESCHKVSLVKGKRSHIGDIVRPTWSKDHPIGNSINTTGNTKKETGRTKRTDEPRYCCKNAATSKATNFTYQPEVCTNLEICQN